MFFTSTRLTLMPPLVGGLVQNGGDLAVDDVTAGQGVVQLHFTDDVAQGGGGQAFDCGNGLVDTVGVKLASIT